MFIRLPACIFCSLLLITSKCISFSLLADNCLFLSDPTSKSLGWYNVSSNVTLTIAHTFNCSLPKFKLFTSQFKLLSVSSHLIKSHSWVITADKHGPGIPSIPMSQCQVSKVSQSLAVSDQTRFSSHFRSDFNLLTFFVCSTTNAPHVWKDTKS